MTPLYYINFRVLTEALPLGPSGTSIEVLARLLRVVHGVAKRQVVTFASAFPLARSGARAHPGTVLRIFTSTREDCDAIAEGVEAHRLAEYISVGRVRAVPQGIGEAVSYRRFRIPTMAHAKPERRLNRLNKGDLLPYLKMRSTSNENNFSLRFECVRSRSPASAQCEPDSYGLSVSDRAFSLPVIDDDVAPWARPRGREQVLASA